MILAEDGRKMSKSLKNYPDPNGVLDEYGADALRAYMINSPVLRAEPLPVLPRWGARDGAHRPAALCGTPSRSSPPTPRPTASSTADLPLLRPRQDRPELDRWVLSVLQSLVADVNRQMEGYYLYAVVPPVLGFIDDLTNWYVRRSRRRFWRSRGERRSGQAGRLRHPVRGAGDIRHRPGAGPALRHRRDPSGVWWWLRPVGGSPPASIHHADYPVADPVLIDVDLELAMENVRAVTRLEPCAPQAARGQGAPAAAFGHGPDPLTRRSSRRCARTSS